MRRIYGLILVLGLSSGCANTTALETEISRLRRELHFVRQDLAKQKRTVDGLERRMTLMSLGKSPTPPSSSASPSRRQLSAPVTIGPQAAPPPPPPPPAPVAAAPRPARSPSRRRTLPVVRLGSNAQPKPPPRQDDAFDPGAQDDGGPPLRFEMGPEEGDDDRLTVDRGVLRQPDPVLDPNRPAPRGRAAPPSPSARRPTDGGVRRGRRSKASRKQVQAEYKAALARLREAQKPQEALALFDAFLDAHPRSKYVDNAAYWRGECYLAMSKHKEALAAFDRLIQRHPRSPKVPFALVRKATSLIATGQKAAAVKVLKTVTDKYSTSEAAQTAKGLLAQQASGQ